jgi:hypothetical protein
MAAQTFRARGMSFPPDDSFGWLDDLYAVPSTGESDDGCLLFFDPKTARRIFYVHINRLLVHIGTFDPVHIGLLLSAKLTTAWTVQFHLPLPCRCRGRATGRPVRRFMLAASRDTRQIERHSAGRPRGLARSLADVRFEADSVEKVFLG